MSLRRTFLTICLVGGLATLASAQVKLERKFKEGGSRNLETSVKLEQKLSFAGMDTETASDTKTTVKVTVGKRDDAGQLRVQEKVESLKISTRVMGSEYNFDSSSPETAGSSMLEILRPIHKGLAQRIVTTVYDKNNTVAAIEFDVDILGNLDEQVRNLVRAEFDTERLKKAANDELKRLPKEAIKKGDVWEHTEKMDLSAGQVMTVVTKYTYEGEVERNGRKLDRVTTKTVSTEFGLEDSPLPFTVKSSDLKPIESKGEFFFDRQLGQTVESTSAVQIVGDIVFVVNNMDIPSKLDLKIESKTTLKD